MKEEIKRVPARYIVLFALAASVTAIFPMVVGGVVSVVIWASPVLYMNKAWCSGRFFLFFPVGVFLTWMVAILGGASIAETALYVSPLKNI